MPYVNIKITREGNVTPEQKQALIAVSYTHLTLPTIA